MIKAIKDIPSIIIMKGWSLKNILINELNKINSVLYKLLKWIGLNSDIRLKYLKESSIVTDAGK